MLTRDSSTIETESQDSPNPAVVYIPVEKDGAATVLPSVCTTWRQMSPPRRLEVAIPGWANKVSLWPAVNLSCLP
jgi:hypothetical protein